MTDEMMIGERERDEQRALKAESKQTLWNRVIHVLTVVMIVIALSMAVFAIRTIVRPDSFQPSIYDTVKVQRINEQGDIFIPQVAGYDAPSINSSDTIPLFFSRCNSSGEPYKALAQTFWVGPDGERRAQNEIPAEVNVSTGCVSIRVELAIPNQVQVDLQSPGADGNAPIAEVWEIQGEVTPTRKGGVAATWTSEKFVLVNADAPYLSGDAPQSRQESPATLKPEDPRRGGS